MSIVTARAAVLASVVLVTAAPSILLFLVIATGLFVIYVLALSVSHIVLMKLELKEIRLPADGIAVLATAAILAIGIGAWVAWLMGEGGVLSRHVTRAIAAIELLVVMIGFKLSAKADGQEVWIFAGGFFIARAILHFGAIFALADLAEKLG